MNNEIDYEVIARNLKRVMKEKKVRACRILEKTGMGNCTISRIVCGYTIPSIDTLLRIANALDVDIREFFKTREEEILPTEFVSLFYGMTPSMQKAIVEIMKVSQKGKE